MTEGVSHGKSSFFMFGRVRGYDHKRKDLPLGYPLLASVSREGKENCLTSKEIIKMFGSSELR